MHFASLKTSTLSYDFNGVLIYRGYAYGRPLYGNRHACCSNQNPLAGYLYFSRLLLATHISSAFIILFTFDEAISNIDWSCILFIMTADLVCFYCEANIDWSCILSIMTAVLVCFYCEGG